MPDIKITRSDHIWNYVSFGLNLGINVLLLPVILYYLTEAEVGLWYVMVSIGTLATLFDFGFAPQMGRQISYCYTGATEIRAEGLGSIQPNTDGTKLFSRVVETSKTIYALIASIVFILLISLGTIYIKHISIEIYSNYILAAWLLYASGCIINIYYAYYNSFFRGIGRFVILSRATVISKIVQFVITFLGLYFGYGILSVALAYLLSVLIFRIILHGAFKQLSPAVYNISLTDRFKTFRLLWHNAWREGIVTLSRYLSTQVNTILCSSYLGLIETAQYALCLQILTIIGTFSSVYYTTVQPRLSAAMLKQRLHEIQTIISCSWVIYILLYTMIVIAVAVSGRQLLVLMHSKTQFNTLLFVVLAGYMFLEGNQSLCASFISTTNKLVYIWPFFGFSLLAIIGSYLLLKFTDLEVWSLVISPFIAQAIYNNWKWPNYVLSLTKLSILEVINIAYSDISKFKINNN